MSEQQPQDQDLDRYPLQIEQAYQEWCSRRDRSKRPDGNFDSKSRWSPAQTEVRPCCAAIRSPSAAYPYSLLKHCCSAEHVANLYSVAPCDLRKRIPKDRKEVKREGGEDYYKAVAVQDGCYYSIFDGVTVYALGQTITDRARQGHGGGIYVYSTEYEARTAQVPYSSALFDAPRVVLRVRAEGSYCRYENGKLAFSRVTPLAVC